MTTEINSMRLTGTTSDLSQWEAFYKVAASKGLITIVEVSKPYPRRNSKLLYSQYYQLKFNGEVPIE